MSTKRSPNPEQKLAIEHTGGKLLSAGAGSGKTFVLVEHVVHLLQTLKSKLPSDELELETQLKRYLSSVVLMTFTKKAAGELQIRLVERVASEVKDHPGDLFWTLAEKHMTKMTVGTIHSFCMKLLKQGFFLDINPNVEVISDVESYERVKNIVTKWFEARKDDEKYDVFFRHSEELCSAFVGVFSDPELRIRWESLNVDQFIEDDLSDQVKKIAEYEGFKEVMTEAFDLLAHQEHSSKKWFSIAESFEQLKLRADFGSSSWFKDFADFLELRMTGPTKNSGLVEAVAYFEGLKKIKEVFRTKKKLIGDFLDFFDNREGSFKEWTQTLKDIFDFVNEFYNSLPGVTFSDLEYLVYKGIGDQEVVDKISNSYKYFIVDEFQDTSEIQFDILKTIAKNDPKKIFCVGDVKQAIYGFRGGDLGVFADCGKFVGEESNLTMSNNYRSLPSIINFNNQFFESLFKMGEGFKGKDSFSVPVVYQKVPEGIYADDETGGIASESCEITPPDGVRNSGISVGYRNETESKVIFSKVKSLLGQNDGNICILYSKLSASKYLIKKLIADDIGFTAQVKVPFGEEPVLGLASIVLSTHIDVNRGQGGERASKYYEMLLESYLSILEIEKPENLPSLFEAFEKNLNTYGLYTSLLSFVFDLGLANSNYSNNLSPLEKYCNLGAGDPSKVLNYLNNFSKNKFSLEFQNGKDCSKVQIMTAHASKGLEFDHVILGGIHSNSVSGGVSGFCGKLPGSFKWKASLEQKKFIRSPDYIVEQFLEAKKQFSESKRLFYVACTRAKKTLFWAELNTLEGSLGYRTSPWIKGIGAVDQDIQIEGLEGIVYQNKKSEIELEAKELEKKEIEVPMFHQDSLGVVSTFGNSDSRSFALIPELSVTKLSALSDCPRKFYLLNICKFRPEEFDGLLDQDDDFKQDDFDTEVVDLSMRSSASRGTYIHETVSHMIERNLVVPVDAQKDSVEALRYASEVLKPLVDNGCQLISEKELKFPLFGFMISGIPDLVVRDGDKFEIWDFKTGRRKEKTEENYWIQLNAYVYSLYILGICPKDKPIETKLVYLDQKEVVTKTQDWEGSNSSLFEIWDNLRNLNRINPDHCTSCSFGNICHT